VKMASSSCTTAEASRRALSVVKPTRSANTTVTDSKRSAMTRGPCLSVSAMTSGRMLSSRRSARACSA